MTQEEETKISLGSILDKVMLTQGEAAAFLAKFTTDADKYPSLALAFHTAIADVINPQEEEPKEPEQTTSY